MTVNTSKKVIDSLLKKNNEESSPSSSPPSPSISNDSNELSSTSIKYVFDKILLKNSTNILSSPNLRSSKKLNNNNSSIINNNINTNNNNNSSINNNNSNSNNNSNNSKDNDDLFEEPDKLESNVSAIITLLIELKKSLYNVVQQELDESINKNKGIINIQSEIKLLSQQKDTTIKDINKVEDGIVSRIENTVTYDKELRERLLSIETTLEIIEFFEGYKKLLDHYDKYIEQSNFIKANEIFIEMNKCILGKGIGNNNSNHGSGIKQLPFELSVMLPQPRILPSIKDQLKKRKNYLKTKLLELFTNSIQINLNEIQLMVDESYHNINDSELLSSSSSSSIYSNYWYDLVKSLESFGLLNYLISSFSINLFETFLKPNLIKLSKRIYKNNKVNNNSNINEEFKIENNKVLFKIKEIDENITIYQVLEFFKNLIIFISNNIFGNNKDFIIKFGKEIWIPLSQLLLNLLLKTRIPKDLIELKEFITIESSVIKFENDLNSIGFIEEKDKLLSLFVKNIEFHYSEKKRTELLSKARDIILKDRYNSIQSNDSIFGVFQENNGIVQGYFFNNCLIFESVHQLLLLCGQALKEALDSSNLICKKLYQGCRDIFELYHSIYLKYHISKLDKVPSLACLFYNSCLFLSHSFLILSIEFQSKLSNIKEITTTSSSSSSSLSSTTEPTTETALDELKSFKLYTFLDFSPRFKKLGELFFSKYIQDQLKWILSFIFDYCNQLENTKDNNQYHKIQSNITNMCNELNRLSTIWKENFPREQYFELISKFSESVISTIIKMILKLQNIEMVETQRLSELIVSMYPIFIKFFLFPGENDDLHKNRMKLVKSWKKLFQIKMVLELPLKEIIALYNNGHLNKLTNNELRLMILSIFDDFELKTNFVSKLINSQ